MNKLIVLYGLMLTSFSAISQAIIANPQDTNNEGGELVLMNSNSIYNKWNIDNYQGNLRFFHDGIVYFNLNSLGDIQVQENLFALGNVGIVAIGVNS